MVPRLKRRSPSVDYLLSALSPRDVAQSASIFIASRDRKATLDEIRRSAARMRPSERAQFALTLGREAPKSEPAFSMVDPSLEYAELIAFVDADPERAVDRFPHFLERNPRSIRTLDAETIRAILLPVIDARQAEVQGTDDPSIPYTDELLSVLHRSLPRISSSALRSALARAFAPVVRFARFVGAIPSRTARVLVDFARAIGQLVAMPFVALGRGTLRAVGASRSVAEALLRALGRVPSILAVACGTAAAAIVVPFAALGRAWLRAAAASQRAAAGSKRAGAAGFHSILRGSASLAGTFPQSVRSLRERLPSALPAAVAIAAAALFFVLWSSVSPLLHEMHARSVAGGRSSAVVAVARPATRLANARQAHLRHNAPRRLARAKAATKTAPKVVAYVPQAAATQRPARRVKSWKFDPHRNPYMGATTTVARAAGDRSEIARVTAPLPSHPSVVAAAAAADISHEPQLVQRARLVVSSYLDSIQRGDASSALGNLGLSANASAGNLNESQILTKTGSFRIVGSALREGGTSAKVDVEILSDHGRYFGVFTVVADGPAVRITDHTVIPGDSVAAHR